MKQIFVTFLLVAVTLCDKLDRKYLPGKPDPFNNGGVSDYVLKSATPTFSGSSSNFGGSTSYASNKYLPPSTSFGVGRQEGAEHSGASKFASVSRPGASGHLDHPIGGNQYSSGFSAHVADSASGIGGSGSAYPGQHVTGSLQKSHAGFTGSEGNGAVVSSGQGAAANNAGVGGSGNFGKFSQDNKHGAEGSFSASSNIGSNFGIGSNGAYGASGKYSATSQHVSGVDIGGSFGAGAEKAYEVGSKTGSGSYGTIGKSSGQGKFGTGTGSEIRTGSGFNTANSGVVTGATSGIGAGAYDNHSGFGKAAIGTVTSNEAYNKNTVGHGVPYNLNSQINTLRFDNNPNAGDGSYSYQYDTENGIHAEEDGSGDDSSKTTRGGYSYTSPEGEKISIEYVADGEGYHPKGSHIPEIPQAILKSIELNKAMEASGIYQEGSYTEDDSGKYHGDAAYEEGASSGASGYQKKTNSNTGSLFTSAVSQTGESRFGGSPAHNSFSSGEYSTKQLSGSVKEKYGFAGSASHKGGASVTNNGFSSGGYGNKQFSASSSEKAGSSSSLNNHGGASTGQIGFASGVYSAGQGSSGQSVGNGVFNKGSVSRGQNEFGGSAPTGYNGGASIQKTKEQSAFGDIAYSHSGHLNSGGNHFGQHSSNPQYHHGNAGQQQAVISAVSGSQGGSSGYSYGPGVGSHGSDVGKSYFNGQKTSSGSQSSGHHSTFSGSSTGQHAATGSPASGSPATGIVHTSGHESGSTGHIYQNVGQLSFSDSATRQQTSLGDTVTGSLKDGLSHGSGYGIQSVGYDSQTKKHQSTFSGSSSGLQPTFGGAVSQSLNGGSYSSAHKPGSVGYGSADAGKQSYFSGSSTIKSDHAFGSQGSVGFDKQGALSAAGQHSTYFDENEGYKY